MLCAGTRGVCRFPRLGDGSQEFHQVVPHLGAPILALLGMQRPALLLPCLSVCFLSQRGSVHLCGGPVRRVSCVSNSVGIPL